jgi:hypothetical protein
LTSGAGVPGPLPSWDYHEKSINEATEIIWVPQNTAKNTYVLRAQADGCSGRESYESSANLCAFPANAEFVQHEWSGCVEYEPTLA